MDIKTQIIRYLRGLSYPATDSEIAVAIQRPEPSVRRARWRLQLGWKISNAGTTKPYGGRARNTYKLLT
jgi:hypothetical protein